MNIYIIIFIILVIVSYIYLKLAIKYKIIDKPNQRSSHTKPTIRGGGILFVIAILLFFFLNDFQYPYFVIGLMLVAIISFIDDIIMLSSAIRFPLQIIALTFVFYQIGMGSYPFWLVGSLFFLSLWTVNAFNFMDGINGIMGLYSFSVLIGLYLINTEVQLIDNDLILYVLLSLIVFGYYNFRKKALFFAGDIGSISIAMLVVFICLLLIKETSSPLIAFTMTVFLADASLTIIYRKFRGERFTTPHREHIYQKLVDVLGMSHMKVSISYSVIQLLINFIIYKTYKMDLFIQWGIAFFIVFIFLILYLVIFRYIKVKNDYSIT